MKLIYKFITKMFPKNTPPLSRDERTKKYAQEVIHKYEKTLRKLSYE